MSDLPRPADISVTTHTEIKVTGDDGVEINFYSPRGSKRPFTIKKNEEILMNTAVNLSAADLLSLKDLIDNFVLVYEENIGAIEEKND